MTAADLFLLGWRFDPVAPLACVAALVGFNAARGDTGSWLRPRRLGGESLAYLAAAIILLGIALVSPLGTLADGYLFSAHMLQHLLLLLGVPPLALLSVSCASKACATDIDPKRPSSFVPGAWLAGVSAMWIWHAPTLCNAATRSVGVHLMQEVSLLAFGTFFFWPILAPRREARLPAFAAIAYLLTACIACTLLGIAVTLAPVEVCSAYLHPIDRLGVLPLLRDTWGLTPQRDQQIGGLIMWLPACLVYGTAVLGILARWYREPETAETSPHGAAPEER
jgi:putative membrane protein